MSRAPARITQADVARAIRAAQQCGAGDVRILPDGTITISPNPDAGDKAEKQIAQEREIVL
jgi:acid phosphatase class B